MQEDVVSGPRFVVGIDLGTTNSAVAYIDMLQHGFKATTFAIPQLVAPGTVETRDSLPSFHYEPASGEFSNESIALPWSGAQSAFVGLLAREHGAASPGRLAVSAKSWLSHRGVDRKANLLPWHGASDITKLSPSETSRRYLEHIRQAWDHAHPDHPLAEQDLVLTVPASFDEVARELTVEAARNAGLPKLCLQEEPQAAFYAWINKNKSSHEMQPGQSILVCDIGGGTTDLTLIKTETSKKDDSLTYRRIAVGEHLLLGGDNLDLALAHHVEQKMGGGKLSPAIWSVLVRRCQQAKENLLQPNSPDQHMINLPTRGRSVVGSSRQVELTKAETVKQLVDGFLPESGANECPETRQSGFQEFGLPYAPDAAISRYVIAFLNEHDHVRPDFILFNGGFFESPILRERLLHVLNKALNWTPQELHADRLDLAVAYGAAEYGRVRRGQGTRITGGLARSYYLGISQDNGETTAVCLLPAGMEEGETVQLTQREFRLKIRQPVEFPLYTSSIRTTDLSGDLLPIDEESMRPMPPIRTIISSGKKKKTADSVLVQLHAKLTEIGTIEVWLAEKDGNREWRLQFDARAATQTERAVEEDQGNRAGLVDESMVAASVKVIKSVLGPNRSQPPEKLLSQLEDASEMKRSHWPPALLRRWFEETLPFSEVRQVSPVLEARWLNLLSYALRPGYGFAADDWRVANAWSMRQSGVMNHRNEMCRAEWWILWRRMAGGLNENQQLELANPLIKQWNSRIHNPAVKRSTKATGFLFGDHESAEVWRLLGSLERLPSEKKEQLGELILRWIDRKGERISNGAAVWALGRIGARVPAYGPLNTVIPADTAAKWAEQLTKLPEKTRETAFALMHLARFTDDRYRDLPDVTRKNVLEWMSVQKSAARLTTLVKDGGTLDSEEQDRAFGETLPPGLHLAG